MKYMCLIYENEQEATARSEAEQQAVMEGYFAFSAKCGEAGVLEAGEPLLETNTATTVRVRDGKASHTDGPFAETREQLGGFYILDCKDLDEAMQWAAQIPTAANGCVEVRPIMEIAGRPDQ